MVIPLPPVLVKRGWNVLGTKDWHRERLKKEAVIENIESVFAAKKAR